MIKQLLFFVFAMFSSVGFAQVCNPYMDKTAPTEDFRLNSDGTATHLPTGLTWMRCLMGQTWDGSACNDRRGYNDWPTALTKAESFEFAGYSDWRLPNIKELLSIVEYSCYEPAFNLQVLPGFIGDFNWNEDVLWTSTPSADVSSSAHALELLTGVPFSAGKADYYISGLSLLVRSELEFER